MFEEGVYYKFGQNVFLISLIRQLVSAFLIVVGIMVLQVFVNMEDLANYLYLAVIAYIGVVFLISWYQYINHQFKMDTYALVIRSGILNHREVSIPYRQIQNVDLNNSYIERMFGVAELYVLTSGREDATEEGKEESSAIFPLVNHTYAVELRDELLRRANVEQVTMAPPDPDAVKPIIPQQ